MASAISPNKEQFNVDIVSDFACPWCLLGKKKLEMAVADLDSKFTFCIRWEPYLLRPDIPPEGGPVMQMSPSLEEKIQHVRKACQEVGLELKSRNPIKMPYTLQAHMLLEYVENKLGAKKQNEMAEILFKAYFIDGKNYNTDLLLNEGTKMGFDTNELKMYLENATVAKGVKEKALAWSRQGIGGVPFFLFNGHPAFSGAQDPQVFKQMILKVAEKFPLRTTSTKEQSANL